MTPLVELSNVSKGFPGVQALSDVSLTLFPGEVHALIGENGAGKSTLMNVLAGEVQPDAGTIRIGGETVALPTPLAARARGIAVVFQELSLCQNLTVGENIMLMPLARGRFLAPDRKAAMAAAQAQLARLGMPDVHPETLVRDLSVAQKQLVEIARAITGDVRVLVLDEPNSALSPRESERLFDIVRILRAQGTAIVYVSHHLDEVLGLADRITVLRDGRHVATIDDCADVKVGHLVAQMVGRDLAGAEAWSRLAPAARGGEALRVRDLRVPGQIAGLDLEVAPGEILGVAGLPDSGKDVLAEAIFGLTPREGEVAAGQITIPPMDTGAAIASGIALIPADRRAGGALLSMSVAENVVSSTLAQHSLLGVLRRFAIRETAASQVRAFDARIAGLSQRMGTLSGGNQQKIILARGIVARPRVLILAEPTRGIDVGAKAEIYAILRRLAVDGMAIIIISSELPEIVLQASRVLVMYKGRMSAELTGAGITEEQVMLAATGSLRAAAE